MLPMWWSTQALGPSSLAALLDGRSNRRYHLRRWLDLTVSGGTVTFGADVGSVTPLGALAVTGPTTLAGNVTTSGGGVTFNSPVQVEGNVSVDAGAGTAAFGGAVNSALAFPPAASR